MNTNLWMTSPSEGEFPIQLLDLIETLLIPIEMGVNALTRCEESSDYGACELILGEQQVAFRVANLTPNKIGQFVTLWQRPDKGGEIEPLHEEGEIERVIIAVYDDVNRGIFVFDKAILVKKGIFKTSEKDGKRGFRLYPPWTKPVAKQAISTQKWQLDYFVPFSNEIWDQKTFQRLIL